MMLPSSRANAQSGQRFPEIPKDRGAVLVYVAITLVVVLLVGALAVDAGTLYHSKHVLQKAADAGALSVSAYVIREGMDNVVVEAGADTDEAIRTLLEQKARQTVLSNMEMANLENTVAKPVTVTLDPLARKGSGDINFDVTVNVTRFVDYLLMDAVPLRLLGLSPVGAGQQLTARAKSRRNPANLILALDVSSSMGCPRVGSCECLLPQRSGAPCASPTKIGDLVDAVAEFLELFDFNSDQIVFVPFTLNARGFTFDEVVALAVGAGIISRVRPNLQKSDLKPMIKHLVERYVPSSSTNISAALLESYRMMRQEAPTASWSVVLVSDGAPSAGRLLLAQNRALAASNPDGFGAYDYIHYSVAWVRGTSSWSGPALLSQTASVPATWRRSEQPPGAYGQCGPTVVPAPSSHSRAAIDNVSQQVFAPCVLSLGYTNPGGGKVFGVGTRRGDPTAPSFGDWGKQYYNSAISYSDFLAENKATVYAIGLGPEASNSSCAATPRDAYQNYEDVFSQKPYFLARLAHDIAEAQTKAKLTHGCPHPEFEFTNAVPMTQLAIQSSGQTGDYVAAANSGQLKQLYKKIGQQILLRLIP